MASLTVAAAPGPARQAASLAVRLARALSLRFSPSHGPFSASESDSGAWLAGEAPTTVTTVGRSTVTVTVTVTDGDRRLPR
jgi:hypothetical protein